MSSAKFSRYLLIFGNILLVAGVFIPWMILTSSMSGLPSVQFVSPGSIIWTTILSNPAIENGSSLIVPSLIYFGAVLVVVGLSIGLMIGRVRRGRTVQIVAIAEVSTGICGLWALLAAAVLPTALSLGSPYPDVSLTFGLPLVILGALLTLPGLMGTSQAQMAQ